MTKFDIAFDYVIENEGHEVSKDKTDLGGVTRFGISEKFIKSLNDNDELPFYANNCKGEFSHIEIFKKHNIIIDYMHNYISTLNIVQAKWIYQKYFWLPIYEKIQIEEIRNYIFDMHVQHGEYKAAELTQRATNAAHGGLLLKVDGKFGDMTLNELNKISFMLTNSLHITHSYGFEKLKCCLISARESLFRCIVSHNKTQEDKLEGWLNRCYRI